MKSPMFHKTTLGTFYNNLATPAQTLFSDCFEAKLKLRVLKYQFLKNFFDLDTARNYIYTLDISTSLDTANVASRQGVQRAFGYNYSNFFSDIIKKYNPFCSLKFTRNLIR